MTTEPTIDVERVDFISVPVSDVARAARFYEEVLGLHKASGSAAWAQVSASVS